MTTPIDFAAALRKVASCNGTDLATIHAAADALERIVNGLSGSALFCPCCETDRTCADDCTFAEDDPHEADNLEYYRSVVWADER